MAPSTLWLLLSPLASCWHFFLFPCTGMYAPLILQDVLHQVETGHSWKNTIQVCVSCALQLQLLGVRPYTMCTELANWDRDGISASPGFK